MIAHFNSSWYWPRRDRRAAWCGVVVVVVVLIFGLGSGAAYREAVLGALVTAVVTTLVTEMIKLSLQGKPHTE